MDVNTKVILYPDNRLYDYMDCAVIDYGVADNVLTIECIEVDRVIARAEAAEAEAAKWRELHDDRDRDLAFEFARANAAETEVAQLRTALDLIDAARAKAVNEIETMHRYLDECFAFAPDEGRAVPLIDRVVLLVSRWAKADGEVERLRKWLEAIRRDGDTDSQRMATAALAGHAVANGLSE